MSGAGRRSPYRKHVTDEALHGTPEPVGGESVARILANRGGNLFEVELLHAEPPPAEALTHADAFAGLLLGSLAHSNAAVAGFDRTPELLENPRVLCILPTRFHKLLWVKRGDFVIVASAAAAEAGAEEGGNTEDAAAATAAVDAGAGGSPAAEDLGVSYMIQHVLYEPQIAHLKAVGKWPWYRGDEAPEPRDAPRKANGDLVDISADLMENTNRNAMNRARQQRISDDSSSDEEDAL